MNVPGAELNDQNALCGFCCEYITICRIYNFRAFSAMPNKDQIVSVLDSFIKRQFNIIQQFSGNSTPKKDAR